MTDELDAIAITRITYDKNGVKYSIYKSVNRFDGMPIPNGFEAIYVNDGEFPDYLTLKRIEK